jgi:hypothetical protein
MIAFLAASRSAVRAAVLLAAAVLLLGLPVDLTITPALNTVKSGVGLSAAVNSNAGPSGQVFMFMDEFSGLYNLYTGRLHMPIITDDEELRDLLQRPDALVIATDKQAGNVLGPEKLKEHTVYREGVGHRAMVVLKGTGPPPTGHEAD